MISSSLRRIRDVTLSLAVAVSSAAAAPISTRQHPVPPPAKHMLFRVHGQTGSTVYLLGSVHLLTAAAAKLPAEVDSAFSHATTVAFEVDGDSAKAHAQELVVRGRNAAGVTLRSLLSPAGAARADSLLHAYGLSVDALAGFKPWLVSVMMAQLAMQKNNFQMQFGVEAQMDARAHAAGKTIIGLEPVEAQLAMFEGLSPADQETMLLSGHTPEVASRELTRVREAWENGNTASLDTLINRNVGDSESLLATLVTDPNKKWIPKIVDLLNGSCDAMVVVGSGHLVGKDGLIALLRARGYTVDQM